MVTSTEGSHIIQGVFFPYNLGYAGGHLYMNDWNNMTNPTLTGILDVIKIAENLKKETRHSWLSDGRHESVAEHTWRMSLMVMLLAPHLNQPVDVLKALQLSIIHDLGEAKVGDVPTFDVVSDEAKQQKYLAEKQCMEDICGLLPPQQGETLMALWEEYEANETYAAKFVRAIDKLEVHLQHVEAPISTWSDFEYIIWFQSQWMMDHCEFDSVMTQLAEMVRGEACKKLTAAGKDVDSLKKAAA